MQIRVKRTNSTTAPYVCLLRPLPFCSYYSDGHHKNYYLRNRRKRELEDGILECSLESSEPSPVCDFWLAGYDLRDA